MTTMAKGRVEAATSEPGDPDGPHDCDLCPQRKTCLYRKACPVDRLKRQLQVTRMDRWLLTLFVLLLAGLAFAPVIGEWLAR